MGTDFAWSSRMHQRSFLYLLAPFAFAACGVGTVDTVDTVDNDTQSGGGGDDIALGEADATPIVREYSVEVTPSLGEIDLGSQMSFTATVSSENYAGTVNLDLSGAMPDWDISYSPSQSLTLAENESVDVIVTLTVATNGTPGAGDLAFAVDGDLGTRTANSTLNVANRLRFAIEAGSGNGPHGGLSGDYPIRLDTEIVIANEDQSIHRIHSDPHQAGDMGLGEAYVFYMTETGTTKAYCHEHANTGEITFRVEQP